MIEAINSSSYSLEQLLYQQQVSSSDIANSTEEVSAVSSSSVQQAGKSQQESVSRLDTVEISAEGKAALAAAKSAAQGPTVSSTETTWKTDGSTSDYTDLSSLTEDEINELVQEGTITYAQAQTELMKRAVAEAARGTEPSASEDDSIFVREKDAALQDSVLQAQDVALQTEPSAE
ncbi:hypothetical protein [Marasmitruncus massiliensis]|uniref:hypothetical protein n=1 Tax=Marasmitruncus massiliensis TaxID=1944642 RepID=UPI000C7A99BE|nr:hypothetical protein [Marasmitruncus massiliensis]